MALVSQRGLRSLFRRKSDDELLEKIVPKIYLSKREKGSHEETCGENGDSERP